MKLTLGRSPLTTWALSRGSKTGEKRDVSVRTRRTNVHVDRSSMHLLTKVWVVRRILCLNETVDYKDSNTRKDKAKRRGSVTRKRGNERNDDDVVSTRLTLRVDGSLLAEDGAFEDNKKGEISQLKLEQKITRFEQIGRGRQRLTSCW